MPEADFRASIRVLWEKFGALTWVLVIKVFAEDICLPNMAYKTQEVSKREVESTSCYRHHRNGLFSDGGLN